jgi:hypothetical protein
MFVDAIGTGLSPLTLATTFIVKTYFAMYTNQTDVSTCRVVSSFLLSGDTTWKTFSCERFSLSRATTKLITNNEARTAAGIIQDCSRSTLVIE